MSSISNLTPKQGPHISQNQQYNYSVLLVKMTGKCLKGKPPHVAWLERKASCVLGLHKTPSCSIIKLGSQTRLNVSCFKNEWWGRCTCLGEGFAPFCQTNSPHWESNSQYLIFAFLTQESYSQNSDSPFTTCLPRDTGTMKGSAKF